jgi:small-conductance mechanosensitive channel/CRP-like cAMP-binding protein
MLADPTSTPLPTLLAVVGFPYAALVGVRILLRRHAHGASYGVSLLVFAIAGFLAWLGAEIDLPLTVGSGTSDVRTVDIPLLRTTAELAAASVVSAFLLQVLDLALRARGRDRLLQFQRVALWLAGVLLGAVAIYQVHFAETLPIRTAVLSIGGASVFIVGLALQSTLGNVFAGYGLQASKVFRKGDFVQLGLTGGNPVVGVVWDSTLATTRILTRDGQMLVIPNGSLLSKDFLNLNQPNPQLREKLRVGISYDVPPANVKDTAAQILASEPNVLQDPAPCVWLVDFGDSSIVYELVFWIPSYAERDETLDRVRTRLWYALKDAGIEIPFPIRTIKMSSADEERARAAAGQSRLDAAVAALRACELFDERAMSAAERRELSRAAIECSFSSGEHVVRRGEESDAMFVVVEGACAVVLPNGDRIALGPGAHFGEIALVTGERRTADVVADSERTNLLRLPKASVEPVLARRPEFQTRVAAIARERREATLGAGAAPSNREDGSGFIRALLRLIRPF